MSLEDLGEGTENGEVAEDGFIHAEPQREMDSRRTDAPSKET